VRAERLCEGRGEGASASRVVDDMQQYCQAVLQGWVWLGGTQASTHEHRLGPSQSLPLPFHVQGHVIHSYTLFPGFPVLSSL
jgi:hypothetical protein